MPSKLGHRKRRHSKLNKRNGERQRSSTTTRQPDNAQVSMPTASNDKVDSRISMPAPLSKPATGDYAYVTAEIKRIGMLTGIILGILIVLALVLR